MTSPLKGGMLLLQDDLEEAQLSDLSPITTRAAARCNAERLAVSQQAQQFSPSPSTSKGKDPERFPSPSITSEHRFNRLELMMERLLGTVQVIAKVNSRYSSLLASPRSPPRIFPEMHESSEDLPAPRIDPQDQLSDQAALPRIQPTVPSLTIEPATQTSTAK